MKSMLRATAAWLNDKVAVKRPLEVQSEIVHAEPVAPPAPALEVVAPVIAPEPEPVVEKPPRIEPADLPKLTIQIKGSTFYAVCPHCESTWNLQQRLTDPRFKRLFAEHGMTCPRCEKAVAMPTPEDLRRRH